MTQEFVTNELAVKLKEIGFDEPCFAFYEKNTHFMLVGSNKISNIALEKSEACAAPTYSQVLRWFRQRHNVNAQLTTTYGHWDLYIPSSPLNETPIRVGNDHWSYEDAEQRLVKELISLYEPDCIS